MQNRIGYGIDVHQLENGTPLIIGGVSISYSKGSKGHSDGDVLFHAIVDAILGSLALGDIGQHFPDTDSAHAGLDSRVLLRYVYSKIVDAGYKIGNADITVMCERPKLAPHNQAMRDNIASDLQTDVSNISVKATTTEKLGFAGRQEGIMASAVVLLLADKS